MDRIQELNREIKRLTKEREQLQKAAFRESVKALFAAHPALTSFSWTQCTPYFNDGDVCRFSAHTDDVTINGLDDNETFRRTAKTTYQKDPNWDGKDWAWASQHIKVKNPTYDPTLAKAKKAAEKFLAQYNDDYFLSAFGDHVQVTVTRKGVTVEEYEHE